MCKYNFWNDVLDSLMPSLAEEVRNYSVRFDGEKFCIWEMEEEELV